MVNGGLYSAGDRDWNIFLGVAVPEGTLTGVQSQPHGLIAHSPFTTNPPPPHPQHPYEGGRGGRGGRERGELGRGLINIALLIDSVELTQLI